MKASVIGMCHHVQLLVPEILKSNTCMHRDIVHKSFGCHSGQQWALLWWGEKDQVVAWLSWLFGYEGKAVRHARVAGEGSAAIIQGSAAGQTNTSAQVMPSPGIRGGDTHRLVG